MNALAATLTGALLVALVGNVAAADIGQLGPTYPISEPHLLRTIEQRLRAKESSGELQRLIADAQQRGRRAVMEPPPIAGLQATATPRTFYFDPAIVLDRNLLDASGRLLFPAGTRANPLSVVSLSRGLLFFDARDRHQVAHARKLIAARPGGLKPILTGGSYLDLMKSWRSPVYYDQQGVLVRRFGIRQVPALVSQEGQRLRIDEVRVP